MAAQGGWNVDNRRQSQLRTIATYMTANGFVKSSLHRLINSIWSSMTKDEYIHGDRSTTLRRALRRMVPYLRMYDFRDHSTIIKNAIWLELGARGPSPKDLERQMRIESIRAVDTASNASGSELPIELLDMIEQYLKPIRPDVTISRFG